MPPPGALHLFALAEQPPEDPPQVARGHDHGAYSVCGEHSQVLERVQVGRVFHPNHEPPVPHAKRQHPVPPQKLFVHQTGYVVVHVVHAQLHKLQAQPARQGFREVGLSHVA